MLNFFKKYFCFVTPYFMLIYSISGYCQKFYESNINVRTRQTALCTPAPVQVCKKLYRIKFMFFKKDTKNDDHNFSFS